MAASLRRHLMCDLCRDARKTPPFGITAPALESGVGLLIIQMRPIQSFARLAWGCRKGGPSLAPVGLAKGSPPIRNPKSQRRTRAIQLF